MRSVSARLVAAALAALAPLGCLHGQAPAQAPAAPNPFPYAEHEEKAKAFSAGKAHQYLDGVARFWMQTNSCGTCHANFAYVMARPAFDPSASAPPLADTRRFL